MKLLAVNERKGTFKNENGSEINWRTYDLVVGDDYRTETIKANADQIDRSLNGIDLKALYGQDIEIYQNIFTKRYVIQRVKK